MVRTVRNEFKLKSRYFSKRKSRKVAGGTLVIPLRLKSKICKFLTTSKLDESNFCSIFDDKFRTFKLLVSVNAMVGKAVRKFSDKSSFSSDDAPYN